MDNVDGEVTGFPNYYLSNEFIFLRQETTHAVMENVLEFLTSFHNKNRQLK